MKKNSFAPLLGREKLFYIVAVSGGPDSTFLLYKMYILGYKIVAAHVNYGKRHNSFEDENLVKKYCKDLSVRMFVKKPGSYKRGNFQAIAREIRYSFFSQIADILHSEGLQVGGVVVGHNFEDLLETYCLQKERNSLVRCWGLPFLSQLQELTIIRPILSFRKQWIINFLKQNQLRYSLDYSNDSEIYRRNVIRKKIFALEEEEKELLSKQIEKENCLLSEIDSEVNRKLKILMNESTLDINNKEWIESDNEVKHRIIYKALNDFSENRFVSRKKKVIAEICKQFGSRKQKIIIDVGKGLMVIKLKKTILLKVNKNYGKT